MALTATTSADLPRRFSKHLVPTERVVVGSRRHRVRVFEPVASLAGSIAAVVWLEMQLSRDVQVLPQLLWLPVVALAARAAWRVWEWSDDWFVVTDRRLMLGYGVLTRKVAMMPMRKVTDMSYNRTPMGQLLNYGEFVLESAGQDQALRIVNYLPDPDHLYKLICTEIFGPDGDLDDEDGAPTGRWDDAPEPEQSRPDDAWRGFRLGPDGRTTGPGSQQDTDVIRTTITTDGDPQQAIEAWEAVQDGWDGDADDDAADGWEVVEEPDEPPRGLRRVDPRRWSRRRRRRWRRDDRWDD